MIIVPPRTVPVSVGCALHKYHWPRPSHLEEHHIVPQAWQRFWRSEAGYGLWMPDTEPLCRTGHGNVHAHLVRLMKATLGGDPEDPLAARIAYPGRGKEYEMAYSALARWKEAGGSLAALRTAKLWGGMYG